MIDLAHRTDPDGYTHPTLHLVGRDLTGGTTTTPQSHDTDEPPPF